MDPINLGYFLVDAVAWVVRQPPWVQAAIAIASVGANIAAIADIIRSRPATTPTSTK